MKTALRFFTLPLIVIALAACAQQPAASPTATRAAQPVASEQDAVALAERFFQTLVVKEDFAAATEDFDDTMRRALPESQLRQTWEALVAQVGPFQERQDAPTVERVDQYERVVITLQFEKAVLDMRVVVDTTTGQISGLFFAPHRAATPYTAPEYVDVETFEERDVTLGEGDRTLPGTLTMPHGDGPFPAIVLVHGSGPNDRDETLGPNKPFKDLAWGLATRGVSVLRYDKRTQVYPEAFAAPETGFTVQEETIEDALAAVSLLMQTEGIDPDRVFVLGHSLGGMLAPRIAQGERGIAGLVILAGATRPLEDLILEQTRYIVSLSGQPSAFEQRQIQAIEQQVAAIKALKTTEDASTKEALLGAPPQYWLDLQGYDPAATARTLPLPMLILQGERDYQVTPADFQRWKDALSMRRDASFKMYPALNHLFIAGSGPITPDEYQKPGHVAAAVIDDIATWIMQVP